MTTTTSMTTGRIQIIDEKTALRTAFLSQDETRRGDVHVCITDVQSRNPRRAWWITQTALAGALQTMTLDELDRLVRSCPRTHEATQHYPLRGWHLPLLEQNRETAAAGRQNPESLWQWRRFKPDSRSYVEGICRWDVSRWVDSDGRTMYQPRTTPAEDRRYVNDQTLIAQGI